MLLAHCVESQKKRTKLMREVKDRSASFNETVNCSDCIPKVVEE